MGVLKVIGKARKEVTCDIMLIVLKFKSFEKNTSQALDEVLSQCDRFLEVLESEGVNIDNICIKRNNLSQDMEDDEPEVEAERGMELRLPFDMPFLNTLSEIIREHDFKVEIDVSFKLSNMIEVHNQLLKDAVMDSKRKAEMIAEAMGQKVIGIEELNAGDRYALDSEERAYEEQFSHKIGSVRKSISNRLKAPVCIEFERVEVEWIIE